MWLLPSRCFWSSPVRHWLWVQKVECRESHFLQLVSFRPFRYTQMVQINFFLLYAVATITPALAHPFARSVLACLTSEYAHSKLFHLVARTPASAVRLVGVFIMEIPMFCEKYTCLLWPSVFIVIVLVMTPSTSNNVSPRSCIGFCIPCTPGTITKTWRGQMPSREVLPGMC